MEFILIKLERFDDFARYCATEWRGKAMETLATVVSTEGSRIFEIYKELLFEEGQDSTGYNVSFVEIKNGKVEISLDEYVFGDCPIFETDVEQLKYLTYTMLELVARNVPAILITRENGKIRVEEVVEG